MIRNYYQPKGGDMKRLISVFVVLAVVALSGCAGVTSDYGDYVTAMKDHSASEQARIAAQAKAIADAAKSAKPATPTESVLLSVIAMQQIERLQPVALNASKPTTYWDVANTAVGHLPVITGTYGMYRLGKAGIEAAGNVVMGDGAQVSGSFNKPETHNTGSGSQAYQGTDEPTVVEVEPFIPLEE